MSDSVAAAPIHERDLSARIDALPASAGLWRFIALLALGGFFELYDLFQTGYISTGLIADGIFHIGAQGVFGVSDQAAFASATFLGLFIGASLLSPYADRFGRRTTFMFALAWYGAFSLLLAFQQQAEWVIFLRFLVGVGLGIELVTIDTYLTEWVPAHLRTRAFAFSFFIQFLSVPAVALMSWWLVPQTILGLSGWRYVVIAGAAASLVIWLVRKGLPESPRWLVQQRRYAQARRVMLEMERRCGVTEAAELPPGRTAEAELPPRQGSFKDIWSPRYRGRTLMLVVMNFFQAIGFFGFGNWLPALLSGKGASVTHSLLYAFFITLAYPLGSLLCSRYADRMENKWQIVLSCLVTVIFGSLFALQNNPLWLILCGFFITWSNAWLTYSYHSYQSEVFPTYIRARAVGFCYSFSRLSTVFSSIIIGIILQYGGSQGVIAFIVASMLIVMLVIGLFGPKTRGIDLENI
ncbi:Inner membrane metabolite transport protein ydjE [Serratia entomophila]|uniref:MFS transporter n=1 Tax=Serratia entomophila TaxID=42906 RepID=UPI001F22D50F|nr:MFS transporter [Serratia entomophila]UIW16902.1 MFS transporter [Serratia entomophila]CAI0723319.1 Inner membrane metabolite transport protein ydjE [Serratia entomophila]CAI0724479.1 Inner membrane metabolite transport protein ydjE [Serratia entomophila]CAI0725087.1 Inner membrane metabolite transport protein ydjE [Serratia entomophila]CAI0726190.1 Inner membrane metabolite transport protein ydjE [Serratia entomophila]